MGRGVPTRIVNTFDGGGGGHAQAHPGPGWALASISVARNGKNAKLTRVRRDANEAEILFNIFFMAVVLEFIAKLILRNYCW